MRMKLFIIFTIFLSSFTMMGQKFHTEFTYDDTINKGITIQNSYPKGGQKYIAPNGEEFVFVIFWTCITNETDTNLEVKIDFSADAFIVPSSPNVNFNLYLPTQEMILEKESMPNYGLDLKSFLDENFDKPSGLMKSISPNDSQLFYMIAISNQGVNGAVRAGFELQDQNLIYKINGHEINCGLITTKR